MAVEQTSSGRRNLRDRRSDHARSADPDADFAALTNRYGLGQRSKKPGRSDGIRWDPLGDPMFWALRCFGFAELGPGKGMFSLCKQYMGMGQNPIPLVNIKIAGN